MSPASPEVAVHELTVRLMEISAGALRAGGDAIAREHTTPRWRPLTRWIRRRESAAVQAAITTMLGEELHRAD